MLYRLWEKLAAEFIGLFVFVLIGAGSICTDEFLHSSGAGGVGLLGIAVAHGLTMAILVTAVGHISGGHLNPAVTIGFWVTRRMGTLQAILYCAAQLLGSVAAAFVLAGVLPESAWRPVYLGAPDLAQDFTRMHGMLLEALMTFFLVFTVFATAVDPRGAFNKIAGFAIGLSITVDILLGGPFTGAAMNPARAFGPALAARHWQNHGVYWLGPLFGGIVAGVIYDRFFLCDQPPA